MRCRKAQEYISRSVDGELDPRRAARLERHLAECGDCRALAADLRKIVDERGRAGAPPSRPSKVWRNIRAGLEAGTLRPSAEGARLDRRPLFGLSLPALRYAGAAALAVVLVVSGVVVGRRWGGRRFALGPGGQGSLHAGQARRGRALLPAGHHGPSPRPSPPGRGRWPPRSWSSSTATSRSSTPPSRPAGRPSWPSRTTSRPGTTCWPPIPRRSRCSIRPWTSRGGTGTPRSGRR